MDLVCPRCSEPWDMDSLHEIPNPDYHVGYKIPELLTYREAWKIFSTKGCGVLLNGVPCPLVKNDATAFAGALIDVLGDDVDGIACELADLGLT